MSNHFVQKIASVVLVLGIFVSFFMAVQSTRADLTTNTNQPASGNQK